jgi:hypothetical protein
MRFLVLTAFVSVGLVLNTGTGPEANAGQRIRAAVTHPELEVRVADDLVVRFKKAPRQFDGKGKPITPTHEQLQALKGDLKLPGYAADYGDLKAGQIVQIRLGKRKLPKATEADAAKKPTWTSLGEITSRVVKVEGLNDPAAKGKGKKAKQAREVEQKVIIEVDTVALVRAGHKLSGGQGRQSLGEDVYATRIMIVSDDDGEKSPSKK